MAAIENKKFIWMRGVCIVLGVISFFGNFLVPEGGMGIRQSDVEKYISYKIILTVCFSLFIFAAFIFWLILFKREQRLRKEKIVISIYFIIMLLLNFFMIDDAYHFYHRYHGISGLELMQKYQEKK